MKQSIFLISSILALFSVGCRTIVENKPVEEQPSNPETVVVQNQSANKVQNSTVTSTTENKRDKQQIAYLSDLDKLFKKRILVLTIPMNDQSYQPFAGTGMNYYRQLYPMWTDVNLTIFDATRGVTQNVTTAISHTIETNSPYFSVEIPAVYRGTPDYRFNRRIDYTKYTSIGEFLLANSEDRVFTSISAARTFWNSADCNIYNEIKYAPRFFLIKLDTSVFDPDGEWAHSRNVNLQIMFNRTIGDKRFESDPNDSTRLIWSPIMPRWSYEPMVVNDYATGDLQ